MPDAPTIAFVTMVRDDHVFLRLWVDYYARHVPRQHLFILLDGFDQTPPDFTAGCQIITLPRCTPGPGWDMRRWVMLADFNATLLGRFDVVVLNDVDEIIVPDPASGVSLLDALARAREVGVISPFAVEVVHRYDICPAPLDPAQPILRQRPHVRIHSSYSKPCITSVPVRWSLGGHQSDFSNLHLDPALFLFHLRFVDRDMLLERQAMRHSLMQVPAPREQEIAGNGWAKSSDDIDDFLLALQSTGAPQEVDFKFEWQRKRITSDWQMDRNSTLWRHGKVKNLRIYWVPERFHDLI
jgi:hypothetical protein